MFRRALLTSSLLFASVLLAPFSSAQQLITNGDASSDEVDADFARLIGRIRIKSPALADDYKKLRTDLILAAPGAGKMGGVSASELGEFNRRLHALTDRADQAAAELKLGKDEVSDLQSAHNQAWLGIVTLFFNNVPAHLKEIGGYLSGLETRAALLKREATAGGALTEAAKKPLRERLAALNREGTKVWDILHADALNIDEMGDPTGTYQDFTRGSVTKRVRVVNVLDQANPLQDRFAALARKLQVLDAILNGDRPRNDPEAARKESEALSARMNPLLYDPFPAKPPASGSAPPNAAAAPAAKLAPGAPALATQRKTLLDLSRVPALTAGQTAASGTSRAPIFTGAGGEDAAPAETDAVNKLRAAGGTTTIGNPGARARYAYHQTGGGTCGIGAQVEVLADAGEVPADPEKLAAKERELYVRARSAGYLVGSAADPAFLDHTGTSSERIGDLLDRPVFKKAAASDDELFKAVSRGRMVIIIADSEGLWNDPQYRGGRHIVAITGAEVNKSTGKPLGYYINDTGTNEGGRFINADQFLGAWRKVGAILVEPL
ncbi:MAG: hypothetical protein ACHQ2Z_06920 [Elusimicrobiota bacterium]